MGLAEKPGTREIPRNQQGCPQLRPQAIEERVSELSWPCSQNDEYLKYHQRTFIQQLMKTEAETCSGTLS